MPFYVAALVATATNHKQIFTCIAFNNHKLIVHNCLLRLRDGVSRVVCLLFLVASGGGSGGGFPHAVIIGQKAFAASRIGVKPPCLPESLARRKGGGGGGLGCLWSGSCLDMYPPPCTPMLLFYQVLEYFFILFLRVRKQDLSVIRI